MHVSSAPLLLVLLAPMALWGLLFVLSKYLSVPLKPLKPWLKALSWVLWGVAVVGIFSERPWRFLFFSAYAGISLVLGWIVKKQLFVSDVKPTQSLASVLTVPTTTYVAVRDVSTAAPWYTEKLGLRRLAPTEEIRPDGIGLQFNANTCPVFLVPQDPAISRPIPVFFTRKIVEARSRLVAEGISAGPLQLDRQGTKFFDLVDSEGNTLEVCEEP